MSVRKTSLKLGMATMAISGMGLTVMPAAMAAGADPSDATPTNGVVLGTTVIGVGSDTTQWVMNSATNDFNSYNAGLATPGPDMANYVACLGAGTVGGSGSNPDGTDFPCGADHSGTQLKARDENVVDASLAAGKPLPNGSGAGRTLLRTPSDPLFNDVAFARSSGPLNSTDLNAGLKALPFAVDTIVVVTSPGGPAPAALSGQQVLGIYNGTYTNWNQVGGSNAPIHPYMPKSGSSTLNAFVSFLASLDGQTSAPGFPSSDPGSYAGAYQKWQGPGNVTTANWNTGAINVEEHDPSIVINDPNAISPFSYGRAQLANRNTQNLQIEGGWSADRELYNVVRGAAISGAPTTPFLWGSDSNVLENIFSPTGWLCTNATAATDIADSGFWPLKQGTVAGKCGVANANNLDTINPNAQNGVGQGASTNTAVSTSNGAVNVTVTPTTGTVTPTGSVIISVVDPNAGTPSNPAAASFTQTVALTNGTASVQLPATLQGSKLVDASYLPTNFGAQNSAGGHTTFGSSYAESTLSIGSTLAGSVPVTALGKAPVLTASVVGTDVNGKYATGQMKYTLNGTAYTANLSATTGTAKITLPSNLAVGSYSGTLSYAGNATFKAGSINVSFTISKGTVAVAPSGAATVETFSDYPVSVAVNPTIATNPAPTGTVTIWKSTTQLGSATLSGAAGSFDLTAAQVNQYLTGGANTTLTIKYAGDSNYNAATKTLVVKRNKAASAVSAPDGTALAGKTFYETVTLTDPAGANLPTGSVKLYVGTQLIGTGTVAASSTTGTVKITVTAANSNAYLPAGQTTVTAVYAGNTLWATSSTTFTVTK